MTPTRHPHRDRRSRLPLALLALLALAAGCGEVVVPGEPARAATPHGRYRESLRRAGLDSTALGGDWIAAAERALANPIPAALPYRETSYFPADGATAVAYRIQGVRGQRVSATIELERTGPTRVFIDVFSIPADSTLPPHHLASADSSATRLAWEPRRDEAYLLRIQPELLRSGRYTVTIRSEPALAFPVAGRDSRAVQSFFGADRDGGRREHHGVDIFAPRGTPVLAAAAGTVSRVNTTPRGGKVVWLRDAARNQSVYYAHLDSQLVASGTRVEPGDTLGLVGNTGNARATPPHLHFGIYRRGEGPIDPLPWVRERPARPARLTADTSRLGAWTRVAVGELPLRAEPREGAPGAGALPRHTALRITGASGAWYRVALPDGRGGFVPARSTEPAGEPVRSTRLAAAAPMRDGPSTRSVVIVSLAGPSDVPVLGRFEEFLLVEAPDGRIGWLRAD